MRGGVLARRKPLGVVVDPGGLGSSVMMCNVCQDALAASRLGEGLAHAYVGARLPNGHDGALEFEEGNSRDHERFSPECVEGKFSEVCIQHRA